MDYIYPSNCTMTMFNSTWNCETVALSLGYIFFLIVGMMSLSIWFLMQNYSSLKNGKLPAIVLCGLGISIFGFIILGLGLISWPIFLSTNSIADIEMFDSEWSVFTFAFSLTGLLLILSGLIISVIAIMIRLTKTYANIGKLLTFHSDEASELEILDDDETLPIIEKTGSVQSYASQVNEITIEHKKNLHFINRYFAWHGRMCARHPYIVILCAFIITGVFAIGFVNFQVQNNPVLLWSTTSSRSYQDLQFMNENYGPFWRIEQMVFTSKHESIPLISQQVINEILTIQNALQSIQQPYIDDDGNDEIATFQNLCFRPIPGEGCLVTTVTGYYQSNRTKLIESGSDNQCDTRHDV